MKKKIITIFSILLLTILVACEKEIEYVDVNQDNIDIFIKQQNGNIGDVMPFYDNGIWNIFYLHDSPPKPGFHPWYRFTTENFYEFQDKGEVIPVVHDTTSQDLALGTGSVIKKDDVYYAFYTAHNGNLYPKETIKLSVSTDNMETWNKKADFEIRPDDPKYDFDRNDFRDPHVVYIPEKSVYYMLFTTRHLGKGAIGYLISDDLLTWEKEGDGIFFLNNKDNGTIDVSSNLECPTLVYFNGFWYLTFSDQWPTRTTHYVYTKNLDEEFIKPTLDVFDGAGLYAGKLGASENRLMVMGWVSYDFNRINEFGWGGNFIAHDLKQKTNGELYVEIIKEIDDKINHLQELKKVDIYTNISKNDEIIFKGEQLEYVVFDELSGVNKITGTLNINDLNKDFGIMFDYRNDESSYFYEFDYNSKKMRFNRGNILSKDIFTYTENDLFINQNKIDFTLLFEERREAAGSIVTLYINNQMALTGRMFRLDKTNFGFYSKNNDLTISNLKLYK